MSELSINEITERAIAKLKKKTLDEVFLFIDESVPLPTCPEKREKAEWKREQIKSNVQASLRQTKTTGPTHIK